MKLRVNSFDISSLNEQKHNGMNEVNIENIIPKLSSKKLMELKQKTVHYSFQKKTD